MICSCSDFDECTEDPCHDNATCSNITGSYTCACNDGYTGDGWNCNNFNECDNSPCDANATCSDTLGSYECDCNDTYTGDGWNCRSMF